MSTTANQIIRGIAGGAILTGVTTTPVALDLRALGGRPCKIWCDEGDIWFCFAKLASDAASLVVSGDQAASTTALVADRTAPGRAVVRQVSKMSPFLVVRMVAAFNGPGTIRVKPLSAGDFG